LGNGFTLSLWDLDNDRHARELGKCHGRRLCFSPDGKILATFGWVENALWDVTSGKLLRSWKVENYQHAGGVYAGAQRAVFTRDGNTLVTAGYDTAIRFWDVATGKQLRQIPVPPSPIEKLWLSPDSKLLATGGFTVVPIDPTQSEHRPDSFVRIWDVTTGKEIRQLRPPAEETDPKYPRSFGAMAFSPDGKVVAGGPGDILRVWDPITGRELRRLALDCSNPWAMTFSSDGNTLAVAVGGMSVRLFDWRTGKDLVPVVGHQAFVKTAVMSADGKAVATIAYDPTIVVWDAVTGRRRFRLKAHEKGVFSLTLGGEGRTLLSQARDKTVRFWDISTGKELRRLSLDLAGNHAHILAVSDNDRLAAVWTQPDVAIVDLNSGKQLHRLSKPGQFVEGAKFSPDGRNLILWSLDGIVQIWDAADGRKRRQFPFSPETNLRRPPGSFASYHASVSPDGKVIAYARANDSVLVLQEIATGKEIHRLTKLAELGPIAFSHDGRTLGWGGLRGDIGLVEVATGRQRYQLTGRYGDGVTCLTFSADGKKLVAGNRDTTVLIWDLTGRCATKLRIVDELSSAELAAAWTDLASADAACAYRAIQKLAASPAQAGLYLSKYLQPAAKVDPELLARLIRDLGSDRFAVRDRATTALQHLGEQAVDTCRKSLTQAPSEEVRRRLDKILDKQWEAFFNPQGERLRALRALEVLELAGTIDARKVLQALATGATDTRLTRDANASLERLQRRRH
jgi:WD40 repeat protein